MHNLRGGTRGTVTLHILDCGYRTPTFQVENLKNLLLSAVNRGDLRTLNYNETVLGKMSKMKTNMPTSFSLYH